MNATFTKKNLVHVEMPKDAISDIMTKVNSKRNVDRTKNGRATVTISVKEDSRIMHRRRSCRVVDSVEKHKDSAGCKYINQYKILDTLGKGAYGKVKRVLNMFDKEYYAIKIINKKMLRKKRIGRLGNALQGVEREIAIWKRLKHRNIVSLLEVIDSPESPKLYMISELVDGGPVCENEKTCTPMSDSDSKKYFFQLIEGIEFLHFHKTLHRDIKPGNLLVCADGTLKLTDFGVSHIFEEENDVIRHTAGTGPFMSPETLTGNPFHGKPVDIWACGVTLYMLTYGHPPFLAENIHDLYNKIGNDPILYPSKVNDKSVDPNLIALLQNILQKDPDKRFTIDQIKSHKWLTRCSSFDTRLKTYKSIEVKPDEVDQAITPLTLHGLAKAKTIASSIRGKLSIG